MPLITTVPSRSREKEGGGRRKRGKGDFIDRVLYDVGYDYPAISFLLIHLRIDITGTSYRNLKLRGKNSTTILPRTHLFSASGSFVSYYFLDLSSLSINNPMKRTMYVTRPERYGNNIYPEREKNEREPALPARVYRERRKKRRWDTETSRESPFLAISFIITRARDR